MSAVLRPWVHRISMVTLAATLLLVFGLGGAVTSTEVGMAYPTWPDINGWSLFNFFYGKISGEFGVGASLEHSHRQSGALIGLLSILLVALCAAGRDIPSAWKKLAWANLALVVVQGLIGAFRVLENNDELGGVVHAVLAHGVVVLLVGLAKISSPGWEETARQGPDEQRRRLVFWTRAGMAVLFLNLVAAATLRHKVGNFPAHLVFGLAAAGVWAGCGVFAIGLARKGSRLASNGRSVLAAVTVQVLLGVGVWLTILGPGKEWMWMPEGRFLLEAILATSHLLIGALVTATATALAIEAAWRPRKVSA
jgi:hypothetical protein